MWAAVLPPNALPLGHIWTGAAAPRAHHTCNTQKEADQLTGVLDVEDILQSMSVCSPSTMVSGMQPDEWQLHQGLTRYIAPMRTSS